MKKIIIISVAIILSYVCANAQTATSNIDKGLSYAELADMYNPAEYIKDVYDPYNPGLYGVCSFFIPGLGQILEDETMRGLSFLGAYVGCGVVAGVGAALTNGNAALGIVGSVLELAGAVGAVAIDIYSVVDALKVAKVKNMYNQDLRRQLSDNIDIKVAPSLSYVQTANGVTPTAGVSLAVRF